MSAEALPVRDVPFWMTAKELGWSVLVKKRKAKRERGPGNKEFRISNEF